MPRAQSKKPNASLSLMQREPVRVMALAAGVLTAAGTIFTSIGQGLNVYIAIGLALSQLAVAVGGGEAARAHAYAPATYDRDVDAHVIIEGPGDK